MRAVKFYVDKVLPRIKLYIEDASPKIKFYVDKAAPKVKFYTDRSTSQIRFYIDSIPARIRFYIETFVSSVLIAFRHEDTSNASVSIGLTILAKGAIRTVDKAIADLGIRYAMRGFIHHEDNITRIKTFLAMQTSAVIHSIEKQIVNFVTIIRTGVKHVDTFVVDVGTKLILRAPIVIKTADDIRAKLSMALVVKKVFHKDIDGAEAKAFLKMKAPIIVKNIEKGTLSAFSALKARIAHLENSRADIKTKLSMRTSAVSKTINRVVFNLTLHVGFFVTHKEVNRGVIRSLLLQRVGGVAYTTDKIVMSPITALFTSATHQDISKVAIKLSTVACTTLADINDLVLADINDKTLHEIMYKEVL